MVYERIRGCEFPVAPESRSHSPRSIPGAAHSIGLEMNVRDHESTIPLFKIPGFTLSCSQFQLP